MRELENVLERALAFCDGAMVHPADLGLSPPADVEPSGAALPSLDTTLSEGVTHPDPAVPDPDGPPASLPDYLDQIEREAILKALERTGGNRTAAARLLGITFRALRHRMQRLEMR